MPADPETVELLREVRDLIAALPAALAAAIKQERAPRRLSQADETALAALLPVIVAAVMGRAFTLRQLADHAQLSVAPAVALRQALATIDPKRLGRLLRRAADCGISGYVITAQETTRDGVKWRVERAVTDHRADTAVFASPRRVTVKPASWKI